MDQINILVVDDEKEIADLVEIYLVSDGYKVFKANNALDGLEILEKEEIHLVLLDIMMPGMDGPEVFRRMQEDERTQGIPVFFMTAVTDRDRVLECMEMNPEEYLVKPVSSSKLLKKLSDLFEKES